MVHPQAACSPGYAASVSGSLRSWISHGRQSSDLEPGGAMHYRIRHALQDLLLVSEKITSDTTTAHFLFHIINLMVSFLESCLVPGSQVSGWEGIH